MSGPGHQIECRCRVRGELGKTLHSMPRAARSRVVATLLTSAGEGIDLAALLEGREELRRLGVLLNQSLRFLHTGTGAVCELSARIESTLAFIDTFCGKQEVGD